MTRTSIASSMAAWFGGVMIGALVLGGTRVQSDAPAASEPAPIGDVAAPESAPPGGPQEGVKVHGSWTIEVRDPDGRTTDYREFENALVATGITFLNNTLSRTTTFGRWSILLVGNTGLNACLIPTNIETSCALDEVDDPTTGTNRFKTLTISTPTTGPNANKLVLQGTAIAAVDGNVATVATVTASCPGSVTFTPDACGDATGEATPGGQFALSNLTTPVVVLAGQQILATVAISWS